MGSASASLTLPLRAPLRKIRHAAARVAPFITAIWAIVDAFMITGWIAAHNNRLISGLNA